MDPTRVIFIDMPRLLRDILRHAVRDAGMEVMAELDDGHEALAVLDREPADARHGLALVARLERLDDAIVDDLLARAPDARMLALADDGDGSLLYELRPHPTPVGDASPARLVAALRREER